MNMSMATLASYNAIFLVYVATFGLSLYAFILSMISFDLNILLQSFSEQLSLLHRQKENWTGTNACPAN